MDVGIGASARIRNFRNTVCRVYSECVPPPVQRPFLHFELPAGVLHTPRRRLGESQWARTGNDGKGTAERSSAAHLASEEGAAEKHSGVVFGIAERGECFRSVGV